MTNSELKQEILRTLSELVGHCPDVRFGQLIVNLSCIARGPTPEAIWDMEDDELLAATRSHLEDYERRYDGAMAGRSEARQLDEEE
jgi:hypothetical protein